MPAKKTATGTSKAGRSRVTTALRKATGVVAKATGRGSAAAGGAKGTAAKKAAATKAATSKAPAKKAAVKKTVAKKAAVKKAAVKKTATKSAAKTSARKTATKKAATAAVTPAKKAAATTKTTTKKTAAKKLAAKKAAKQTRATTTKAPAKKTAAATKKAAGKPTTAKKAVAKKTAAPAKKAPAGKLRVRDDESPWTAKELAAVRAELEGDVERLTHELSGFEDDIAGLIKDSGDGAGDDQADTGAKTFEREHEASLAQNSRDLLEQSVHALQRIDDGTYGICENCGNAIGKLRLQAFPRATLCLNCKAQQERR